MNESIKTFSLVVITICVFIMTVISVLDVLDRRAHRHTAPVTTGTAYQTRNSAPPNHQDPVVIPNQPLTSIKFAETKFDFGEMKEGEKVRHNFSFTNTGTNPLIISNAKGSCGCTVPTYPKEPIPPGGSGVIEVEFNSAGRSGLQNKSVSVTANTNPPVTVLVISSNVIGAE